MIKRIFFITILLSLVLAACQGTSPIATEDTSSSADQAATMTEVEPTQEPVSTEEEASPPPTAIEADTSTDSTPESPFSPVSNDEWVVGPESAAVTLVEYGDFQ
jgi:predicted small secreted protein